MEFTGAGIDHIGLHILALPNHGFCQTAFPGGVVDLHTGLDIIGIDIEADTLAVILHRPGLHSDTAGQRIIPLKNRDDTVEHVVAGFLNIVSHHVFKGQHALHIHIAGASDQIPLVGILTGELKANQMAAVIQIFAVHEIVFRGDPAGGAYHTDIFTLLRGHQVTANAGHGIGAAVQGIQIAVGFIAFGHIILQAEPGHIVLQHSKGFAGIGRNLG